jgi:hypothetical protein
MDFGSYYLMVYTQFYFIFDRMVYTQLNCHIVVGIGTPIVIDETANNWTVDQFAWVFVEQDHQN